MNIDQLDDLCLLIIFDKLWFNDLLLAGHVCSRWNFIRRKSALSRTSLTLLIGPDALFIIPQSKIYDIPYYHNALNDVENRQLKTDHNKRIFLNRQNHLNLPAISNKSVKFLSKIFPNIKTLTCSLPSTAEAILPLTHLLKLWNSKVQILKLYSYDCFNTNENDKLKDIDDDLYDANRTLVSTINSMSKLRELIFDLDSRLLFDEEDEVEFEFVETVEQFAFNTFDVYVDDWLADSLERFGEQNRGLKQIAISSLIYDVESYLELSPELSSRFTHLNLVINHKSFSSFHLFCNHFTNLTTLELILDSEYELELNPQTIYQPIAALKHLIFLNLMTDSDCLEHLTFEEFSTNLYRDLQNFSIKVLRIAFRGTANLSSHFVFSFLNWDHLFPEIRVLFMKRDPTLCIRCRCKGAQSSDYVESCLRRMMMPLAWCKKATVIQTTEPDRNWVEDNLWEKMDDFADSSDEGEDDEEGME